MRENKSDNTVLVDSDAFVGYFYSSDAHHQAAVETLKNIDAQKRYIVTTSLVVAETATVLSNRKGQETAREFLTWAESLPVIHITEELQREAITIFREQTLKGSSVVDCANVAVMRHFTIPAIFSFDKVYAKKFGLKMVA